MKKCLFCENPILKFQKGTEENPGMSFQLNLGWLVPFFIILFVIKRIAKEVDKRV